jgi:hypothetical protein
LDRLATEPIRVTREYMVKQRAAELTTLAKEAALYSALHNAAQPYGGVAGYVGFLYEKGRC